MKSLVSFATALLFAGISLTGFSQDKEKGSYEGKKPAHCQKSKHCGMSDDFKKAYMKERSDFDLKLTEEEKATILKAKANMKELKAYYHKKDKATWTEADKKEFWTKKKKIIAPVSKITMKYEKDLWTIKKKLCASKSKECQGKSYEKGKDDSSGKGDHNKGKECCKGDKSKCDKSKECPKGKCEKGGKPSIQKFGNRFLMHVPKTDDKAVAIEATPKIYPNPAQGNDDYFIYA